MSKALFPPAWYSWRMYLRNGDGAAELARRKPGRDDLGAALGRLIAPPTVFSIATYCFAFGLLHQYWPSSGSFQIC